MGLCCSVEMPEASSKKKEAPKEKDDPISDTASESALGSQDPQNKLNIVLSDITPEYLKTDLSTLLKVQYLSPLTGAQASEWYSKKFKIPGLIVGSKNRFMVNLPICRNSCRYMYSPTCPKEELPFFNVFFLVATASPYSFVSKEVMEALLEGNIGNPLPSSIKAELITGDTLEFHLCPAGVTVLGGNALSIASISSKRRKGTFVLDFV